MQKNPEVEFKSLLTEKEYLRILKKFPNAKADFQTNHYFDTKRFTLKASNISLRVRERNTLELTMKKNVTYNTNIKTVPITKDEFDAILRNGEITQEEIAGEINRIIGEQKLINYLSLSTLRYYTPYAKGILNIDRSEYVGVTDYEIEYTASSYQQGKNDFVQMIADLGIQYKKSDKKIKRAFNALKNQE